MSSQFVLTVILIIVGYVIYYFSPTYYSDLITITPKDGETTLAAFSHKIPMIFFGIVTVLLVFFSLTRKLSLIPVLGLLSCLYLMTELGVTNWLRFAVWLLFGFSIYFGYGYVNSHLGEDGDGVRKLNNYLRLAMVGFLVSGLGLAGTAFTFVADFVLYFIPSMSADSVLNLEIGLFIVGLVAGVAGVLLQSKEQTVVVT